MQHLSVDEKWGDKQGIKRGERSIDLMQMSERESCCIFLYLFLQKTSACGGDVYQGTCGVNEA